MKAWPIAVTFLGLSVALSAQGGIGGGGRVGGVHGQSPIGMGGGGRAAGPGPGSPGAPAGRGAAPILPPTPASPIGYRPDVEPLRSRRTVPLGYGYGWPWWSEWSSYEEYVAKAPREEPAARPALRPAIPEASSIQPALAVTPRPIAANAATGRLRLSLQPRTGQLYVDGFYAGDSETIADAPAGLSLSAGWHRLEFRAPGYETAAANVTIVADKVSTVQITARPIPR